MEAFQQQAAGNSRAVSVHLQATLHGAMQQPAVRVSHYHENYKNTRSQKTGFSRFPGRLLS